MLFHNTKQERSQNAFLMQPHSARTNNGSNPSSDVAENRIQGIDPPNTGAHQLPMSIEPPRPHITFGDDQEAMPEIQGDAIGQSDLHRLQRVREQEHKKKPRPLRLRRHCHSLWCTFRVQTLK